MEASFKIVQVQGMLTTNEANGTGAGRNYVAVKGGKNRACLAFRQISLSNLVRMRVYKDTLANRRHAIY